MIEIIPDYSNILMILHTMTVVICMGGATLLFLRGRKNRSRRILAGVMSAWGLVYVVRILGTLFENEKLNFITTDVVDTQILIIGNLYLIFLLLYPLEIVRPGWLNLKRTGLLLLPYASVSLLYYIILLFLDQKPLTLENIDEFLEHIGEFNVWYRILMTLSVITYLTLLFRLTWHYKEFYRQWCRNNYSDDENMEISWLRQYGIGVVLIGVGYFGLLFNGNTYYFFAHNLAVQSFFCYTLYKGLFHNNPYTENFFSQTLNEADACRKAEIMEKTFSADHTCPQEEEEGSESTFLKKLPVYCDQTANWMTKKKPYLNPNFKLIDVSEILPLNRTYLSRVFNEGFGNSFSDVVRNYRLHEAEWMLVNRKDIPVGQVGELCGFSSPSVFHRAFVQSHNGLTPNRYRKQSGEDRIITL